MWFDARAALAKLEARGKVENPVPTPANPANPANPHATGSRNRPPISRLAGLAAPTPENQKAVKPKPFSEVDDFKHGFSVAGSPLTWTGKVVSLAAWRELSEWERHGPDGRRFNRKSKEWETPI